MTIPLEHLVFFDCLPVFESIHFRSIVRLHYYWATSLLSGNQINKHFECILTGGYVYNTQYCQYSEKYVQYWKKCILKGGLVVV